MHTYIPPSIHLRKIRQNWTFNPYVLYKRTEQCVLDTFANDILSCASVSSDDKVTG